MNNTRRATRQTLTIARRDFIATVFTPTFLLFLFAPLIMSAFGLIGGLGASSVAADAAGKERLIAIVAADQAPVMRQADARLRPLFGHDDTPATLFIEPPSADPAAQARAALDGKGYDVDGVLYGPLDRPQILYPGPDRGGARYLAALAEATLRAERSGGAGPLSTPTETSITRGRATVTGQHTAGFFTVLGLFFLTVLLAGQAVGTMAEERSNKVIEVLAAAVPLESVFLGKLLGMFGSAVLFIAFWGTIASQVGHVLPAGAAQAMTELAPAVGFPLFVVLFCAYFTMAYLLLGAVFLTVGAQATTIREIQMLSLPITFTQFGMFGLASAAASHPGTWLATFAEVFPLSSPFAMGAHAANSPELWPHALALAWQLLWVTIVIRFGARWFRRGVLQSGSGKKPSLKALFRRA